MFENDWILRQLALERQRDLLRQIERDRLVRQARPISHQRGHTFYHVLDWTGRLLVRWGERLKARHALYHASSLTTSHEVNHG